MLLRDIKHIKINNKSKETQKGTNLFLGGKAEITIPPIRAPRPSSDTINPTSKLLNENFSIIRIPIKERNGRSSKRGGKHCSRNCRFRTTTKVA